VAAAAAAQSEVHIGGDGIGCVQGAAVLSDASAASAHVMFDYDKVTARLLVTVVNTSPFAKGVPSPVITRVYFNVPRGTVTGATLLSQGAESTMQPAFVFTFDADIDDGNDWNQAGCLGFFNFRLASAGVADGIANAEADSFCVVQKQDVITGAVSFLFQLVGPDVHGLDSEVFAASSSRSADVPVNVAVKFDGANCTASGTIGNGDPCREAVFLRGTPRLGEWIAICIEGGKQCRAFLGVSANPGPEDFKKFTLPIGQPVLWTYDFGFYPAGGTEFVMPLYVPIEPILVGAELHWTSLMHEWLQFEGPWAFAPAFSFTVLGLN
jgi:hypothetical protein